LAQFGEIDSAAFGETICPVGEIDSATDSAQDFRAIFYSRCTVYRWLRRAPCVFCADFNFSVYGEKIEMDFAAEVVCSRKANQITKQ
jgi:hypothetical protein